jgi:hypothetical protein
VLREVTELAVKDKIARHEALVLLVKLDLAGIDMAERLSVQAALELDIADALEPIKSRRPRLLETMYEKSALHPQAGQRATSVRG